MTRQLMTQIGLALCLLGLAACGGGGGGGGAFAVPGATDDAAARDFCLRDNCTRPVNINPPIAFNGSAITDSTSNEGGVGRMIEQQVDGVRTIVTIISLEGINSLVSNPSSTKLLGSPTIFDYRKAGTNEYETAVQPESGSGIYTKGGGFPVYGRGNQSQIEEDESGKVYTHAPTAMLIYVDKYARVMLARPACTENCVPGDLQFVTIGDHATSLPTGDAKYSGYAAAGRKQGNTLKLGGGYFTMTVDFGMEKVIDFAAYLGATGNILSPTGNIRHTGEVGINMQTGAFEGNAHFIKPDGPNAVRGDERVITDGADTISSGTPGKLYGQFHGQDATGVTGAFHNGVQNNIEDRVIGAFAGSKE